MDLVVVVLVGIFFAASQGLARFAERLGGERS